MLCVESQHYLAARTLRNYPVKLGEQGRQNYEVTAVALRVYVAGELSCAVPLQNLCFIKVNFSQHCTSN